MEALGIGQLAKRGGVGIDTVRYYERHGLLAPRSRLASGYRRYGAIELARLRFIRRAQGLGFTLKEIKQLLALSAQRDVGRVKRSAQAKLLGVQARIAGARRTRNADCSLSRTRSGGRLSDPAGAHGGAGLGERRRCRWDRSANHSFPI
jgi:MerR family copper efflux transcriptional regulator